MDKEAQVVRALLKFKNKNHSFFTAEVKKVEDNTCTVDYNGTLIANVRLCATTQNNANKFVQIPAVGSFVLVASVAGELSNLSVVAMDQVNQVEWVSNGINLKEQINNLLDELVNAKILTPSGTGLFSPANVNKFNEIKQNINQILK